MPQSMFRLIGQIVRKIWRVLRPEFVIGRSVAELVLMLFSPIVTFVYGGVVVNSSFSLIGSKGLFWTLPDLAHVLLIDRLFQLLPTDPIRFAALSALMVFSILGDALDVTKVIAQRRRARSTTREGGRSVQPRASMHSADQVPVAEPRDTLTTPEYAIAQLRGMEDNRGHKHLYSFLNWKYGEQLGENIFTHGNLTFPLAAYPAKPSQLLVPQSALRSFRNQPADASPLLKNSELFDLIQLAGLRQNKPFYNRPTYTMRHLVDEEQGISLDCEIGTYFDMVRTCDSLEWEIMNLVSELKSSSEKAFKSFARRLTLRNKLHAEVNNPVREGARRSVAISISTLIAFYDGYGVSMLLRKRSEEVAVHPSLLHVLPSFMFQPASVEYNEEFSIVHNILREYLEELFSNPEPEPGQVNPHFFYSDPRLAPLQQLLSEDRAQFYFTGIAVNLLSLRPEVCTVLLIKDEHWYQEHRPRFKFNPEFYDPNLPEGVANEKVPVVNKIPLTMDDDAYEQLVHPRTMVPCGAFAFWAGVKLLRSLPEVQARIR